MGKLKKRVTGKYCWTATLQYLACALILITVLRLTRNPNHKYSKLLEKNPVLQEILPQLPCDIRQNRIYFLLF